MFSHGLDLASMVVSSDLIHKACTAICNTPFNNQDFSISIQVSPLLPNNGKIIAFRSSLNCTVQNLEREGKDLVPSTGTFFHFIATKVNPIISINKAAVQGFASLSDRHLTTLQDQIIISEPLLVTGDFLGGSIASLFTIWLLDTVYSNKSERPICITFGSPLIGDINFQKAIYQRSSWPSCFLHVALSQDPIPKLFLSPAEPAALAAPTNYKPFGSFLFCSESGCACFDQPELVFEVMVAMSSESVGNMGRIGIQIDDYRRVLVGLKSSAKCKGRSELGDSDFNPLRVEIVFQLEAIGVIKTQQQQQQENNDTRALIENMERKQEYDLQRKRNAVDPKRRLNKVKISMTYLEWYKKVTTVNEGGYYDGFKKAGTIDQKRSKAEIVKHQTILTQYWKDKVQEADQLPQKKQGPLNTSWLYGGTNYRRMVEPLEIADYYMRGNRDYINTGRSEHYKLLQKWFNDAKEPPSQTSNASERKKASLTEDSCFWAHVEEALISIRVLKNGERRQEDKDLAVQKLIDFEVYVMGLIQNCSVSPEIFLEKSTFMEWWKEYKQYKEGIIRAPCNSSLAIFMRNGRERYI